MWRLPYKEGADFLQIFAQFSSNDIHKRKAPDLKKALAASTRKQSRRLSGICSGRQAGRESGRQSLLPKKEDRLLSYKRSPGITIQEGTLFVDAFGNTTQALSITLSATHSIAYALCSTNVCSHRSALSVGQYSPQTLRQQASPHGRLLPSHHLDPKRPHRRIIDAICGKRLQKPTTKIRTNSRSPADSAMVNTRAQASDPARDTANPDQDHAAERAATAGYSSSSHPSASYQKGWPEEEEAGQKAHQSLRQSGSSVLLRSWPEQAYGTLREYVFAREPRKKKSPISRREDNPRGQRASLGGARSGSGGRRGLFEPARETRRVEDCLTPSDQQASLAPIRGWTDLELRVFPRRSAPSTGPVSFHCERS
ncbi:hypothetical protein Nepgr_024982 [Nepenthes gracilis]|uniref:Uncharacterized protein n=1 Tax=Nepenthes gracilis TaxID=150966 RepID=A0AAD3T5E8_NEPGR|nr:hypothetical protein Nepgr_024982 [Nepenthes gracilis]